MSEVSVTLNPREVEVVVEVDRTGADGANPWAETARRAMVRVLANMVSDRLLFGCVERLMIGGCCCWRLESG